MQHSNEVVEEWRTIEGFENYEVSNLGRVRRVEYIKQREDFNGYPIVNLYKGGEGKTAKVHRLVAQAFIPNPNNLPQVNHINEVKTHNIVTNLEWCSQQYNNSWGTRLDRIAAKHCKPIQQLSTDGTLIEEFDSTYDAQAKLDISNSNICACLKGRRRMAGGFLWRYK